MRKMLGIFAVVALSYFAFRALLVPGFFPMHDATQVGRVVVMGRALRNGQFPVRWVSGLGYGYGYPIFNFYGPLPYYVGGILYALGLSGLAATKAMIAFGIVLSGVSMYLAARKGLGDLGAVVTSVFYVYAPYHAVEVYVRGAVGELWVLPFLPFLLWGFLMVGAGKTKRGIIVGGVGLAGIILSHTLLGYATTLLILVSVGIGWCIAKVKGAGIHLKDSLALVAVGLGLSAFFWLPATWEMGYTNVASQVGPTANVFDHFICPSELWDAPWGFGGSAPGCIDGLSFKLGKIQILTAVLALFIAFFKRIKFNGLFSLASLVTLVSLFFTLPLSAPLWKIVPQFTFLQYPWRFLTLAIFGLSLLTGTIIKFLGNAFIRVAASALLVAGVIVTNAKLFTPQYQYAKEDAEFETSTELRWRVSKISDEYLPPSIVRPRIPQEVAGSPVSSTHSLEVETEIDRETYGKFMLMSKLNQSVPIARAYFPGWRYWVNGQEVLPTLTRGLPSVTVPEGQSVVEIRFGNTPVRTLANAVSLLTLFLLLYVYGKKTDA